MRAYLAGFILLFVGLNAWAHTSGHDHGSELKFSNGAIHAHLSWVQGPQSSEESVLRVQWMDGNAHVPAEPPGEFKVTLWMPEHNHGSSPTHNSRALDSKGNALTGAFEVSKIYFIMAGDWEVRVSLAYPDGTTETQVATVTIDGGHHH